MQVGTPGLLGLTLPDYLRQAGDRSQGAEDRMWTLISDQEFLFNHAAWSHVYSSASSAVAGRRAACILQWMA